MNGDGQNESQKLYPGNARGVDRQWRPAFFGAAASSSTPFRKSAGRDRRGIQLAELFALDEDHEVRLASQIGITHAIVGVLPALNRGTPDHYVETLRKIKTVVAARLAPVSRARDFIRELQKAMRPRHG